MKGINPLQKIVNNILYYARSVDPIIRMALSILASEPSKATALIIKNLHQLLSYLGTHPDATIQYYESDMILNFHSDASYLSAKYARS